MAKKKKIKRPEDIKKLTLPKTNHKKNDTGNKSAKSLKEFPASELIGSSSRFPIVGIGASAGGLEAFTDLLEALPNDTGMAFVFVQHLDPSHHSMAPEILSRSTKMRVQEVTDGMQVLPNNIYLNPPNYCISILNGHLSLLPRIETRGQHLTIDFFFLSLAKDQQRRAIGVVLSGAASDGTLGLKNIKDEGGLAIAQDPKSAKYDGMPKGAIASGVIDLILPPKGIAQELTRISKHPYIAAACETNGLGQIERSGLKDEHEDQDKLNSNLDVDLRKIFALLHSQTKIDFSNYKHTTLKRRIQRRMMVRKIEGLNSYAKFLQSNPTEIKALYADMLINVTEFFRDPDSFETLKNSVFPQLMKKRTPDAAIRIWVPGCSTGEEVYSIAILLLEFMGDAGAKIPIQIFATDISESTIKKARAGVYAEGIERSVSKERLNRFFDKVNGGFKINKSIRDLCLFSKHDVTSDPPFSKLDLVSCRNVLIYFAAILQKRVIPVFHYSLNHDGFLFMGRADSPGGTSKLFTLVDKTHKIYSKINVPTPMTFRFPLSAYVPEAQDVTTKIPEPARSKSDFQSDADRISLLKYAPPSVVVNSDLEILQFRGRTVPFLEPASGLPSSNILKMAREELLHGLRMTIQAATKQNLQARQEGLAFVVDGKQRYVNIEVIPANPLAPPNQRNLVIFFEEVASITPIPKQKATLGGKVGAKKGQEKNIRIQQSQRINQLEQDALANKQYQQSMAEEFEAAKEELTAANEELQSTNEELQSTNEEMETAKEEIQSSNEELTTVNDELQNRNSELALFSSDLNNVLSSVEIPILIVGSDHRIRRFTPKAEKFFKLIPSDVGRPIGDIKTEFDLDLDLDDLIREVGESLRPQEKEIKDRQDRWVRLQIRPYKTVDNRIDGAVITLMDIEALKKQVAASKRAQDYHTSVAETVQLPLAVLDVQLRLLSANSAFWEHFKLSQQFTGRDCFAILEMQSDSAHLMRKLLTENLSLNEKVRSVEMDCEFTQLGHRSLLISASFIDWIGEMAQGAQGAQGAQEPKAILLSLEDITERKRIEIDLARETKIVRLFESVTTAANEATSFDSALQIFLDRICVHTKWPVGYAFLLSNDGSSEFRPSNVWHLDDPKRFARFREATELSKLAPGDGLAGKVSANGKPVFILDLIHDSAFTKAKLIEETGVKSAIGFPVFVGGSIVAVLKFLSEETKEPDQRLIQVITHVIPQLSRVFERKLSEEATMQRFGKEQEARANAEDANQTKDEFLATLSHELRTPLTSILSWSQLIQKQKFDPEKIKHGIKMIEQSAKMQGQLIDDLLDVNRIRSGKLSFNFAQINPSEPVILSVEAVRALAESRQILIELEIKIQSEKIWADGERLQQVVWNLLTNAIKFSSKGGVIRVLVEPVEESGEQFAMIRVSDQGKGISPEFVPRLFERFSQADSSSIRVHGGLGLGLAIVRDLIQLQGGKVRAESDGVGKGATFTVLLPSKSGPVGMTSETNSPLETKPRENVESADLAGLCVMVVDDNQSTLEVLREALHSFGAKTFPCHTVLEALEAFESFKPDVLISDISMPVEDGYSLIRKIRSLGSERRGDIPSLALTAYATKGDIKRALSAGFDSHMAKPFDTFRLGRAVAELAKNTKVKPS